MPRWPGGFMHSFVFTRCSFFTRRSTTNVTFQGYVYFFNYLKTQLTYGKGKYSVETWISNIEI